MRVINRLKSLVGLPAVLARITRETEDVKYLLGVHIIAGRRPAPVTDLSQVEFGVYSQWGEDGVIEYLVSSLENIPDTFIEFGVEDYRESNTRFLLLHRNWKGLVMDGSGERISYIQRDRISWRHELEAKQLFVTAENINAAIRGSGMRGEIGLLSIDIDGNDYWIWKAIDVVSPWIVVVEYNSVFGATRAVTIPYDPSFQRRKYHFSQLCFGASLAALKGLAREKGYVFIGTTSAGINAFFVRQDVMTDALSQLAGHAHFTASRVRESRDREGKLTHLAGDARLAAIKDCIVYDCHDRKTRPLSQIPEQR